MINNVNRVEDLYNHKELLLLTSSVSVVYGACKEVKCKIRAELGLVCCRGYYLGTKYIPWLCETKSNWVCIDGYIHCHVLSNKM